MAKKMKIIDYVVIILLIAGGLNWGLEVFNFNLVSSIFGGLSKFIYGLVGIASLYSLYWLVTSKK